MEPIFRAHPIPQNVTNFEFHLVGDMTLKQFGYLAGGVGLAFLVFTTLSTSQPILAWPIIIISALLGVAFAFLPIQERPLDHWVGAFFKAIFQPTFLKFSSKIINPDDPLFGRRLSHYIRIYRSNQDFPSIPPVVSQPPRQSSQAAVPTAAKIQDQPQKKQNFIDKFKSGQTSFAPPETSLAAQSQSNLTVLPAASAPTPAMQSTLYATPPVAAFASIPGTGINPQSAVKLPDPAPVSPVKLPGIEPDNKPKPAAAKQTPAPVLTGKPEIAKAEDLKKTVELAKEAQETQKKIVKIESSLSQIKQQAAQPGVDPKTYIENFEDLLTELQELNQKASETARELAKVSKSAPEPQIQATAAAAPIKAKSIPTLKLTSFPNVINGIITDSTGNYLEGAIVVAHDRQGLPVRALKSNKLGQFVAATPLPNGEYSIVVEKDGLAFDKVSIELTNEILPPILVAAKKIVNSV